MDATIDIKKWPSIGPSKWEWRVTDENLHIWVESLEWDNSLGVFVGRVGRYYVCSITESKIREWEE